MTKTSPIVVFDAYGTLFDIDGAARSNSDALGPKWLRVSEIWRAKQREYTWVHAGMGCPASFEALTRSALLYALAITGQDLSLAPALLESYRRLPPFPDVAPVLSRLRATGAKISVLSNGDPEMLDDLVRGAGLLSSFDALISTSTANTFKPSPQVYKLCCAELKAVPTAITFVSSNRWDIAAAKAFGFQTIWINRRNAPDEYPDLAADRISTDLSALF